MKRNPTTAATLICTRFLNYKQEGTSFFPSPYPIPSFSLFPLGFRSKNSRTAYFHSHSAATPTVSRDSSKPKSVLENLISGFDKNINNLDDALRLFVRMLRLRPVSSTIEFNQLLTAVAKMKHYSAVVSLFRKMILLDIPVDEYTMGIVINCYCSLKEVNCGFSVLGSIFKRGYVPDVVIFTTLLKGLFSEGKNVEGERLFKKLMREKVCEPNVHTLRILVHAFRKEGMLKDAEEVVRIMIQRGQLPNVITYNALMHGHCRQGRLDKATQLFNSMADGVAPDVVSYNTLINGYCKKNKIDEAMHLFREMPRKGLNTTIVTYNTMLQGLFQVGRCTAASQLLDEMRAAGQIPDTCTYCILLDGFCKNGLVEQALSFLDTIESEGLDLHVGMYNIIIDGLCEYGKLDAGRDLFRCLSSKGLQPDVKTYTIMIKGLCHEGLLEEAKELLVTMKENNILPNSVTFNVIVQGFLKSEACHEAMIYLEEMVRKGFSPDASTSSMIRDRLTTEGQDSTLLNMILKFKPKDK